MKWLQTRKSMLPRYAIQERTHPSSLTSKYCPSWKGLKLSSRSSAPQQPPIWLLRMTTPSWSLGFRWKAMSREHPTTKLMLNLHGCMKHEAVLVATLRSHKMDGWHIATELAWESSAIIKPFWLSYVFYLCEKILPSVLWSKLSIVLPHSTKKSIIHNPIVSREALHWFGISQTSSLKSTHSGSSLPKSGSPAGAIGEHAPNDDGPFGRHSSRDHVGIGHSLGGAQ